MISFLLQFKWKKVSLENKKEFWEISWVVFDINYEKIIWFTYKKHFLKYDFFLIKDIISYNDDLFLVKLNTSSWDYFVYDLILKQVRDYSNNILWNIEDIEFDITYKLKNIIIDAWYNLSSIEIISPTKISIKRNLIKISKKAILSYNKDYVLIESRNIIKENKKTLENISKIFINIPNPSYNINFKKYDEL